MTQSTEWTRMEVRIKSETELWYVADCVRIINQLCGEKMSVNMMIQGTKLKDG